jgi:hypothetical protein
MNMTGRPGRDEAATYYFTYVDRVPGDDVVGVMEAQLEETTLLLGISEEASLHRYAPDKWSIREVLSHINDTERVFLFRAFWFARGFDTPLPSFDQDVAVASAHADDVPWEKHIEEFRTIRQASLSFFRNLPAKAWAKAGIASGNPFTVKALAYVLAGHAAHHVAILEERYLASSAAPPT